MQVPPLALGASQDGSAAPSPSDGSPSSLQAQPSSSSGWASPVAQASPTDGFGDALAAGAGAGAAGAGTFFTFRPVTQACRVTCDGGLDYWVYTVQLDTDYPIFTAPRGVAHAVSLTSARRYKEFEWLRTALLAEFPGLVIPALPGLTLEGTLDKWDRKAQEARPDDELPTVVGYRMKGFSYFLEWIGDCAPLRSSPTLWEFLERSPSELERFQAEWAQSHKPAPQPGLLQRVKASLAGPGVTVDPFVAKAQSSARALQAELTLVKDKVETMWDTLATAAEDFGFEMPTFLAQGDEVMSSVIYTCIAVTNSLNTLGQPSADALFDLVAVLQFLIGLCKAIQETATRLEGLTAQEAALAQKEGGSAQHRAAQAALEAGLTTFRREVERFTKRHRKLVQDALVLFGGLAINLEPVGFDWQRFCMPAVDAIPTGFPEAEAAAE